MHTANRELPTNKIASNSTQFFEKGVEVRFDRAWYQFAFSLLQEVLRSLILCDLHVGAHGFTRWTNFWSVFTVVNVITNCTAEVPLHGPTKKLCVFSSRAYLFETSGLLQLDSIARCVSLPTLSTTFV